MRRPGLVTAMLGLVCGLLFQGCERVAEPTSQVLLYVTTDAPMGESAGLFDRLIVDVYAPFETVPCEGCSRRFAVDDDRMARGQASFGIFTKPGVGGYRARARLYRSGGTTSGEPRRASTLESFVSLPVVASTGLVETTVTLHLADLARPQGTLEKPLPAEPGAPPDGVVGSFLAGRALGCSGQAGSDEVCVPGGLFWMGNPRIDVLDAQQADGKSERVVVLSPYFLDLAEVTVEKLRAARVARVIDDPIEGNLGRRECVYTAEPSENDVLPVNCLSWQRARAYCAKVGKRLPSEAEYEYVAGGRTSQSFGWGGDSPACGDAVFARGTLCGGERRPVRAGSGGRDRVLVGGVALLDLAGNLRELMRDRYRAGNTACWGEGVLVDPVCEPDTTDDLVERSVRGGSFGDEATLLRAAQRSFVENERFAVSELVGFRCARSGR